ncbi:MAG: PocR ligand-binding domain-containing protein [Tyzzerella sp.]|nr:PocR ligand-binding domain-containing protein [Tyzzerella sp.]
MESQQNNELMTLVRNFGTISNATIAIFDANRNLLASYPDSSIPFCGIIRKNEDINEKCTHCDILGLSKCYAAKKPYLYHCHMGLVEIASPIMYGDTLLGYILIGQFTDNPDKEQIRRNVMKAAKQYRFSASEPLKELDNIVYLDSQYTTALTQLIEMCSNYIWLNRIVKLNNSDLGQEIRLYIATHLTENLSVDTICSKYNISPSGLYQLFQKVFGCGVVKIIREERIKRAKELLLDSNFSISDIASQVGILDANYFIRVFKAETGMTPGEYRKLQGK